MEVHLVSAQNSALYKSELEENYRNRHWVFVEKMGWEGLRKIDCREIDEFDNEDASNILLLHDDHVCGGLRLTSMCRPTLLETHFRQDISRPLPDDRTKGADWTRFYILPAFRRGRGTSLAAGALFCAAMEYAVGMELTFLTFVSSMSMLELLVSLGWRVTPLGAPRTIEGELSIAAYISVDDKALANVREYTGLKSPLIFRRGAAAAGSRPVGPELLPLQMLN